MNYNEQTTKYIVHEYNNSPSRSTVERLARELEKPIKSIIGKLSKEGVYRREVYKTKQGDDPETKLEIVQEVAALLEEEEEKLKGLEKSPKLSLKCLRSAIQRELGALT